MWLVRCPYPGSLDREVIVLYLATEQITGVRGHIKLISNRMYLCGTRLPGVEQIEISISTSLFTFYHEDSVTSVHIHIQYPDSTAHIYIQTQVITQALIQ